MQQAAQHSSKVWRSIQELNFISAFFGWLFLLASRLAEPLMTISAIYIILCAGIPGWKLQGLYDSGEAVLIAAPEVILPGAFILAGQEREHGNKQAWLLDVLCWLFVILTAVTLATLFLWQGPPAWIMSTIMWGRCVVSIGYSILLRVTTHRQERQADEIDQLRQELQASQDAIQRQLQQMQSAQQPIETIVQQLDERYAAKMTATIQHVIERVTVTIAEQQQITASSKRVALPEPATVDAEQPIKAKRGPRADANLKETIRALVAEHGKLSGYRLGELAGCSHTRAIQLRDEVMAEQM